MTIASLAMYDQPRLHAANDRLWEALAEHLREAGVEGVPPRLTRGEELDRIWCSRSLFLAQTCGYPLMTELRGTVQLVATPCYAVEGCDGAWHRAAIVVRADDPALSLADLLGRRAGINDTRSNSGANLFRAAIAPFAGGSQYFREVVVTGSHAASVAAVLSGRIDVASIDAVTLAHLGRDDDRLAYSLRVLDWTAATPGLPFVTAATTPWPTVLALRAAVDAAFSSSSLRGSLDLLRISGFEVLDVAEYAKVLDLELQAKMQGYPVVY